MDKVSHARALLHSAANAEKQLQENVRELVSMRAWEVLGYTDFSAMWFEENGYACPTYVQTLAVETLVAEGLNTGYGRARTSGHTRVEIAKAVGLPVRRRPDGFFNSKTTTYMILQLQHGVPANKVIKAATVEQFSAVIAEYGDRPYERQRPQPRRLAKAPDELVKEGFQIPRRDADEVEEIAREADVPKAEIYRQAVAEYLDRLRASRQAAS